jgi:hypothetical protein
LSDLYLVELIAYTATDVILSFFAWMPHFFSFSLWMKKKKRKGNRERDQLNQQCERYWLKHYHFLYWVSLTNLEAICDYVWMSICSCLMLIFFLIRTVMLSKLRMFTIFKYCSGQSIETKNLSFFFTFTHFIWQNNLNNDKFARWWASHRQ